MAMVDANYKFVAIEVGAPGSNSDAGIFDGSNLGRGLLHGEFALPDDRFLPSARQMGKIPYFAVGDEAFPLRNTIMRPYPGRGLDEGRRIFNYRLSRARRVSENAFGQLANRWRVFHTVAQVDPDCITAIIKGCCVLHNFLSKSTQITSTQGILAVGLGIPDAAPANPRTRGGDIRDNLREYFQVHDPVDWQSDIVNVGL